MKTVLLSMLVLFTPALGATPSPSKSKTIAPANTKKVEPKKSLKEQVAKTEKPAAELLSGAHSAKRLYRIKGEIVSIHCALQLPFPYKKEDSARCLQKALEDGLPVGILTPKGRLYQITESSSQKIKTVHKRLAKYSGKKVQATGEIYRLKPDANAQSFIVLRHIKSI